MADIIQEITIAAPPQRIFDAITSREGLLSWWTDDATRADAVGQVAEFGFFKRAVVFRMRVDELKVAERIRWSCIGGPDDWLGTELTFEISPMSADGTRVRFIHSGWRAEDGMYPSATSTWAQIMPHLKKYTESGVPGPYFTTDTD
jgi:uncharacterized protein YndB with AHSA1/START domain